MNVPVLNPRALVSLVADGYVVYDLDSNQFHELNPAAAFLLELCNGSNTVEQIVDIAAGVLPNAADAADDAIDTRVAVLAWIAEATSSRLLQQPDEAASADAQAEGDAGRLTAADLAERADSLRDDGYVQAAFVCQEHAVQLAPDQPQLLRELGELAHILGRREAAREAFGSYLKLVPDDAEVRHLLTSLRDEAPPERVPDECIRQLYQRFASFYESNMCGELGYEGPVHLTSVIDEVLADRSGLRILDLGCGTGLAGLAVHARAERLVGVDLSAEMVERAAERGIYDDLHTAEVTDWLQHTCETFDLIIACDTFIYFGDLSPVLRLAAERLSEDGVIAFSVERADSGQHQLTDNGRYVHHRTHVDAAARSAGLSVAYDREAFLRMEYGSPVDGLFVCLSGF
ncbi:MAG: PqqD family peptide modification chaperone [Planctomycetaceae bacterium]|nr:PqqD family peptide modification chaperone [Planctomycetaceae bacterium]